jgi:hypothetical protein
MIPERRVFPTSLLSKNHPIRHHVAQKKKLTRNSSSLSPYTQKNLSATAPETQVNALSLASAIEQQVTSDGASSARSPYRQKKKKKKNYMHFRLGFYVGVKRSVGQVPVLVGENFSGHIMGSLTF